MVSDIGFQQLYMDLNGMKFFSYVPSSVGLNNESQKNENFFSYESFNKEKC